jgi:hypothetical protein
MTHEFELSEEAINKMIADLSDEFAREVGAFADVFERWRRPEVARKVVESLLNNDREAFNALLRPGIDPAGVDPEGKRLALCYKLLLLAEKLGQPKLTKGPMICRLKTGLSLSQRLRYLAIARQFRNVYIWEDSAARGLSAQGLGPIIPPGPFLDALTAEGLVDCKPDETVLSLDPYSGVFRGLKDVCGFQL